MLGFQKTKTLLLKDILKIGQKKFFFVSKIKDTVPWTYVISDLNSEKIARSFMKKNCKKQIKKILE